MCFKNFKYVILLLAVLGLFIITQAQAARLAEGEYSLVNAQFEDSNSFDSSGWMNWLGNGGNTTTVINDSNFAYYGNKSIALHRDASNTVIFQNIEFSTGGPLIGDAVEAGAWVMFDSEAAADTSGQVVLQVKYVVGTTPTSITTSAAIPNKQAGKWYYILTSSNDGTGKLIPPNAEKIQVVVDSWINGTVYVDFVQCGKINSIGGNPSKLALAEYHTWFGVPEYLPNPRKYTDPNYTGFASYNSGDWKHWEWHWPIIDDGYNSDPAFYEQIGFCAERKYQNFYNTGFEISGYAAWGNHAPPGGSNVQTTEKAYDGNNSGKFVNPGDGGECSLWQKLSCNAWNNASGPAVPNTRERIMASVMVNFADVDFSQGRFWIQVAAVNDDPNMEKVIAKSYEYVSQDYINKNKDPNGWVKIQTRPVDKGVIPDWATGITVAIKFYHAGTIYVDKVEVGEAEYSNVQRQTATANHPKPRIGPYNSTDDELIGYHLDLCKAMLFDVMLVDYYGHQFPKEDYQRVALGKLISQAEDKEMKVCCFYEPKVHLNRWTNVNYYINMRNVSEMNAVDTAKVNEYIDDVTAYDYVSQIADINLVKHYVQMAAIQDDIKYILQTWGGSKSYLAYRGKAVVAIFGIYNSLMSAQDWANIKDNLSVHDGSYKFILVGDSAPAENPAGWFDAFTGMMNWALTDESLQDKNFPTQEMVFNRSKDVINGQSVNWAAADANRFAVGLTYPQFNNIGVGGWEPLYEGYWHYYIFRTPVWNGDFYKQTNAGLLEHVNDLDWIVVATFNDWNEGTSIEPSVEEGYLYSIITQDFIEDFKGIANEPNDLMQQITEKVINTNINMDVDTSIEEKQADDPNKSYSGAACLKMVLDYEGFNTYTQDQLHNYAIAHNELADQNTCIDPKGMHLAMNNFKIDSDYNYGWEKYTSLETMYDRICYWMAYDVPQVAPRPQKMPAMIPLNGNYMDWVVVNGYSTDDDPYTSTSYTINGFWITDPDVNGIGKNIYITAENLGTYYKKIISNDSFNGYYAAVLEPPMVEPAKVKIAKAQAYAGFKGDEKSIKAAAVAGLKNLLKNKQFKSAYKDSKAGKPISASNGKDNYFIVPFTKNNGCSIAVIIDGKTGAFRQASYNDVPDKHYLSKFGAVKKSKKICNSNNPFVPDLK